MEIKLYYNASPKKQVTKTLTEVSTIQANLLDNVNILQPQFRLSIDNINAANYCYVPDFNRYYYITYIDIINKNQYMITLDVDVLMTYDAQIRAQRAVISRQAVLGNYYISDNLYPVQNRRTPPQTIDFPSGFQNSSFQILTVSGGDF